jgi:hypothetical protein
MTHHPHSLTDLHRALLDDSVQSINALLHSVGLKERKKLFSTEAFCAQVKRLYYSFDQSIDVQDLKFMKTFALGSTDRRSDKDKSEMLLTSENVDFVEVKRSQAKKKIDMTIMEKEFEDFKITHQPFKRK